MGGDDKKVAGAPTPASVTPTPKPIVVATPVSDFTNISLRDSLDKALSDVDPGHGTAILDVDNRGTGIMVVKRFDSGWALVAGGRYSWVDKGVSARVMVSF